jgi:hypothetical protein
MKIDALLAAGRNKDVTCIPALREWIFRETDPFVLATIASALGKVGTFEDVPYLIHLLANSDSRVVANALDAIAALDGYVPAPVIERLLESGNNRVRANLLGILAKQDPARALGHIPDLYRRTDVVTRSRIAHLLGTVKDQARALDLILEYLAHESHPRVLSQLVDALSSHVSPATEGRIIAGLDDLLESPARRTVAETALRQLCHNHAWDHEYVKAVSQRLAPEQHISPPCAEDSSGETTELGDTTLSFAAVWGEAARPIPTDSGVFKAEPKRAPIVRVLRARSGPPTVPRPGSPANAPAAGVLLVAIMLGLFVTGRSESARLPPGPPASGRMIPSMKQPAGIQQSRPAWIPPAPLSAPSRAAAHTGFGGEPESTDLGPVGSTITVEGVVVSVEVGKAVIRSKGRLFVLRGTRIERLEVGRCCTVRGALAGVLSNGIVLLDVSA